MQYIHIIPADISSSDSLRIYLQPMPMKE